MVKYNLVQYIYHGFDKDKLTIDTLSDGYIEFENVEQTRIGWYDNNGNIKTISNSYIIIDIKNDKVILQKKNDYENYDENTKIKCDFIIIDITGKFLRHTTAINIYDNMYLLKNENNKMTRRLGDYPFDAEEMLLNAELKKVKETGRQKRFKVLNFINTFFFLCTFKTL